MPLRALRTIHLLGKPARKSADDGRVVAKSVLVGLAVDRVLLVASLGAAACEALLTAFIEPGGICTLGGQAEPSLPPPRISALEGG